MLAAGRATKKPSMRPLSRVDVDGDQDAEAGFADEDETGVGGRHVAGGHHRAGLDVAGTELLPELGEERGQLVSRDRSRKAGAK